MAFFYDNGLVCDFFFSLICSKRCAAARTGNIANHERMARRGLMNEMPMETVKKIVDTSARSVVNLIVDSLVFLSIRRWFLLAYVHVSVKKMPAAAWSAAYKITPSCKLLYWSRTLVKKGSSVIQSRKRRFSHLRVESEFRMCSKVRWWAFHHMPAIKKLRM